MTLPYEIWDVFTLQPLQGNPLALIPDASGLSDAQMQAIAKEFNLSETSFVLPSEKAEVRARYFTPSRELPMAGHPTIGTVFALHRQGKIQGERLNLELAAGIFPIKLESSAGTLERVWMEQGIPKKLAAISDRPSVAKFLNLAEDDLMDLPMQIVSAGNPFFIVPLKTLEALAKVQLNPNLNMVGGHKLVGVFVFTKSKDAFVQCRMLATEGIGVDEDPATGSAHGPLGWYLATQGMLEFSNSTAEFVSHQGVEMGRPSQLYVRVKCEADDFLVAVGGQAVLVARGELFI
jgi:trans-2,3-dihydro-3-hydroxyanthranilate isomerase